MLKITGNIMRRILITGGAGFMGSNFIHYWLQQYPQDFLVILDTTNSMAHDSYFLTMPKEQLVFIEGTIQDRTSVLKILKKYTLHTIIHFAAETSTEQAMADPAHFLETNVLGTHRLLQAAVDYQEQTHTYVRFHHVSTSSVYGPVLINGEPFIEGTPHAPNNLYAASKSASDGIVHAYGHNYGLPITISHGVDTFGAHQQPTKLIPKVIQHILKNQEIILYGDGYQTRSWLYAPEHCQAIDLILHQGKIGERYNIGSDIALTNVELVRKICQGVESLLTSDPILAHKFTKTPFAKGKPNDQLIRFTHDTKGHDIRYAVNSHKAMIELGFKPQHDLDRALTDTIAWYLNAWLTAE
jgi:dTDP-glucose 4,6-dehydratase